MTAAGAGADAMAVLSRLRRQLLDNAAPASPSAPSAPASPSAAPPIALVASARQSDAGLAAGALFGLAVGDALGTTLEFRTLAAPAFPRLADGPHREVIGQGPFDLLAGQVTDDTQMALCLFHSLLEHGHVDAGDVARRYLAWRTDAFDIGSQTSAALDQLAAGAAPRDAGRTVWDNRDRRPAGNGALMRTAPVGVLLAADPASRRQASMADAALTHADPRCQLASAAFNAAIARAVTRGRDPLPASELVVAAGAEIRRAADDLGVRMPDLAALVASAADELADDLRLAAGDDPQLYGPAIHLGDQQGFVRVAFRLAFWELLHAPSFEVALIDVVNRGGDADTNGAITGALLGAYHGIDAIPDRWLRPVGRVQPGPTGGPFSGALHPLRFLDGLEAIHAAVARLPAAPAMTPPST